MNAPTDAAAERRNALVEYAMHYGPRCRECADEDGICPMSGMACGDRRKATEFVVDALIYGATHGHCPAALTSPPTDAAAVREAAGITGETLFRAFMAGDTNLLTTTALPSEWPNMKPAWKKAWEDYAAAIRQLDLPGGEAWRTIDSAPQDREIMVGCWVHTDDEPSVWSCWVIWGERGNFGEDGTWGDPPTHWREVPTPPALTPARVERSGEGGGA